VGRSRPGLCDRIRKREKRWAARREMMAGRGHAMVEDEVS
jgi:hypothetical protein